MVTLVAYYSFSGRTHYEAKRMAEKLGAELYEVREQRHRSMLSLYFAGPAQARRRTFVYIEPFALNLEEYDKIVIMSPIWGGWPAPAFNSIVRELPVGKEVEIYLTSDSGKARDLANVRKYVERRGVNVTNISVIKTEDLRKRDRKHNERRRKELADKEGK